ncbi:MAG: hypothetical protein ABI456_16155 [Ktedonobacteraceae bacterium]
MKKQILKVVLGSVCILLSLSIIVVQFVMYSRHTPLLSWLPVIATECLFLAGSTALLSAWRSRKKAVTHTGHTKSVV